MADKKVEKGGGGDSNKGLVLFIIWGGILFLIFGGLKSSGFLNVNLDLTQKCQANNPFCNVFGFAYKNEELKTSNFHYQKNADVYQITASPNNSNLFYAATNFGVFFTQDKGKNWRPFSDFNKKINQDTMIYKIINGPKFSQEMFISTYKDGKGTIYKSDNNLFLLTDLMDFNKDMASDIIMFRENLYLGLRSGKILSYSLDTKKVKQVTKLSSAISMFSNVSDRVLYVITSSSKVFESTDGINFTHVAFGAIKDIVVSQDGLAIYAITDNGLFKSLDFGNNYVQIKSLPLDANKIEKISASSMSYIYVFGNHQIYESLDGGANWKSYDNEINRTISAVNITDDVILVGTKSFNFFNLWQNLFRI